mmetsp:Transcript_102064/g.293902  ORF Transcript_102064/g.293902 Transcript_102064/m.293902 type:complete len:372 (+) Transcript_102064:278-1393(+)
MRTAHVESPAEPVVGWRVKRLHLPAREEVVALVVDEDEGGEVDNLNFPHGLHAELLKLDDLDPLDVRRSEHRGRTSNAAKVEAAVCLARIRDLLGAVALGESNEGRAVLLEDRDVAIHAPARRWPERARRQPFGRLRRACVVHRMPHHVIRQRPRLLQAFIQACMGDVAGHDHGTAERHTGLNRVLGQCGHDLAHRPVQVNLDNRVARSQNKAAQEPAGIVFQLLDEHALRCDLREDLPVGAARNTETDWARSAVAGQANNPGVMGEIFAAELRPHLQVLAAFQHLRLPIQVPEGAAKFIASGGQVIVVPGTCQLNGLHAKLGGGPADDKGHMVRWACCRAQGLQLFFDESLQLLRIQQSLRLLEQVRLVR